MALMSSEFILPVLGLGAEDCSPTTVVWHDGTVLCRGILGGAFDPAEQEQPDNIIYFCEEREKRRNVVRERPL
jgi:hypothetical protein